MTLNTRSIVKHDPMQVRPSTPIRAAGYTVRRTPVRGAPFTQYEVLVGSVVVLAAWSPPSEADCLAAVERGASTQAMRPRAMLRKGKSLGHD